jgi:hypothetical protein
VSNFALTRVERVYAAIETTSGTAVAASNSNCTRAIKFTADNEVATIARADKTGTRTTPAGTAGRRIGKWSCEMSLAPNGAAGVKPDADPFLSALFGVATGTVAAGVSVSYALTDAIKSMSLYSYRQPSTIDQRASIGSIVQSAEFNIGQDGAATWSCNGQSIWALESNQFSAADPTQKGGLVSFAAEPSTPVTNGGIVAGFTGVATINGAVVVTLRTAKVSFQTGNSLSSQFGSYYGIQQEGAVRKVSTSFSLFEDDGAGYAALVAAAEAKTLVNFSYQIGTVAGSIVTINLVGVQLSTPTKEEQIRYIANFGDSDAHGTGNKDEINMVIT